MLRYAFMKIIDPSNKIWNVHVWILWILRYLLTVVVFNKISYNSRKIS